MRVPEDSSQDIGNGCLLWFAIGFTLVSGLLLVVLPGSALAPLNDQIELASLLKNVGYGFIGGGGTAAIFQLASGKSAARQQKRLDASLQNLQYGIGKIPEILSQVTLEQRKTIDDQRAQFQSLSNLLVQTQSMGIVAIGRDRTREVFTGGMSLVERWLYFLEHAREVDLLCWEDSRLLDYKAVLEQAAQRRVRDQVRDRVAAGELRLRILLSAVDNPALDLVNRWINSKTYMQGQVKAAEEYLAPITDEFSDVLRRHRETLAFTLLRGDTYMYVMYFFPSSSAGPILEIRPLDLLSTTVPPGDGRADLYTSYRRYFNELWDKCRPTGAD